MLHVRASTSPAAAGGRAAAAECALGKRQSEGGIPLHSAARASSS